MFSWLGALFGNSDNASSSVTAPDDDQCAESDSEVRNVLYRGVEICYVVLPSAYAIASIASGVPVVFILTAESVSAALGGESNIIEIFKNGSPMIATLGASLGIIGTFAVVPFTSVNSYKFISNLIRTPSLSKLFYLLTLSSGVLNADNTFKSYRSLGFSNSAYIGAIAYLFGIMPGLSNGEVLSELFWRDGMSDLYILRYLYTVMRDYFPTPETTESRSNQLSYLINRHPTTQGQLTDYSRDHYYRSILLGKLALLRLKIKLSVSDEELNRILNEIENGEESPEMREKITALLKKSSDLNFPLFKALASEITGSIIAAAIAIFGNVNSIYAGANVVRSVCGNFSWMLEYIFADYTNEVIEFAAQTTGWLGAGISSAMWFYLLRSVVIRPLIHSNTMTWRQYITSVLGSSASLIPAAALCTSNIIVTISNPELSGYFMSLVLISSIAGNAVLSLSGIPDSVRGLLSDFQKIKIRMFGGDTVLNSSKQSEEFCLKAIDHINGLPENELRELNGEIGGAVNDNKNSAGPFWNRCVKYYNNLNKFLSSNEVPGDTLPTTTYGSTGNTGSIN